MLSNRALNGYGRHHRQGIAQELHFTKGWNRKQPNAVLALTPAFARALAFAGREFAYLEHPKNVLIAKIDEARIQHIAEAECGLGIA